MLSNNFSNNESKYNNKAIVSIIGIVLIIIALSITIIKPFGSGGTQISSSENNNELMRQLEKEQPIIVNTLNNRFAFLKDYYKIEKVVLFDNSAFATVILTYNYLTYKTLLTKKDGQWQVEGLPSATLFYEDFADVPPDIIKTINDLEI